MPQTAASRYAVDNASILYLSLIRKNHTNTYRFTMTLKEEICPEILQNAVDRIYRRFPTVIAGFYPGFFQYFQVPVKAPPQVQRDPGCLITMSKKEIHSCAYRVYYSGRNVSIEAFHALADGYGAIASFTTLVAEYLQLRHGIEIPAECTLVDIHQEAAQQEITDSYLDYEAGKPLHLPSRYSYQIPGDAPTGDIIQSSPRCVATRELLDTARRYGVSITALLSGIMASSVMEIQHQESDRNGIKPVRIMVPIDLRRLFPSRTLRNFILYALPTMEPQEHQKPFAQLLSSFRAQMEEHLQQKKLASIMAYNVRTQNSWLFRIIPRAIKCAAMRLAYRYFGESNSSVTLTNLGNVTLPEEMAQHVENLEVILTPRAHSPYNCAVISYNNRLCIHISRFGSDTRLEDIFFRKLHSVLEGGAV